MCGGFTCSKNALTALNILYIIVAFFLVGVATHWEAAGIVTSLPIVGGIIACGVFLLCISIVGLIGAIKHHQVLLFFYMVILFLLFLIQFSVACACLAVSSDTQKELAEQGWSHVSNATRSEAQQAFDCCGFKNSNVTITERLGHPSCAKVGNCCAGVPADICCNDNPRAICNCLPCMDKVEEQINSSFKIVGGIGLFFSFTEIVGAILACRYRNLYDPQQAAATAVLGKH